MPLHSWVASWHRQSQEELGLRSQSRDVIGRRAASADILKFQEEVQDLIRDSG